MTNAISPASTLRSTTLRALSESTNAAASSFTRHDPASAGDRESAAVDSNPGASRQIAGYNRLTHFSGRSAAAFAYGPNQIPDNPRPESRELVSLRNEGRQLIGVMDDLRDPAAQKRGVTFYTQRGEPAIVRKRDAGGVEILVNGKPTLACFNDSYYPGSTHIMMATPSGPMGAGRHMPPSYVAEARRLVGGAQSALLNGGNVHRQLQRWGR